MVGSFEVVWCGDDFGVCSAAMDEDELEFAVFRPGGAAATLPVFRAWT